MFHRTIINLLTSYSYKQITYLLNILFVTKNLQSRKWILISTLWQVRKVILGPCPTAKSRLVSFNRTQSRVVTGFLTGHNTLRRHLHLMGLSCSPLRRRYGAEEETSIHVLFDCEAPAAFRYAYLGPLFWTQRKLRVYVWGTSGAVAKEQGSLDLTPDCGTQWARLKA